MAKTHILQSSYESFQNPHELSHDEEDLLQQARDAMNTSYSPYSKFKVGAAVMLKNGEIITGSNQENASYPLGLCAERVALFTIGAMRKGDKVAKIAVIGTPHNGETTKPIFSCGGCRQVIAEYEALSKSPCILLFSGAKGEVYRFVGIESILPHSFRSDNLVV